MQHFAWHGFGLDDIPRELQGGTVLPGNFDGWHRGHRNLCRAAGGVGKPPLIILTFEPHPRQFFNSAVEPFRLTDSVQKLNYMRAEPLVAGVVTLAFDSGMAATSASDFIDGVLVRGLRAMHVALGYDFRFGKGRAGSADDMRALIETSELPAQTDSGGEIISSSRIRSFIADGDVGRAMTWLGRPYAIRGEVRVGDRLGRDLGFATANLTLAEQLRPSCGVYITQTRIGDEARLYASVTNYGFRPTVDGHSERFETHIFDYSGDLYGKLIEVFLLKRLRGEEKFADIDALKFQIGRDCLAARDYFRDYFRDYSASEN